MSGTKKDSEKYTRGGLAQLARRRMTQKNHGDNKKYNRKNLKNNWDKLDPEI